MENEYIYVYGISENLIFADLVVEQESIECLAVGEYKVIAKFVSPHEFSDVNLTKKGTDIAWLELHARNHLRVISEAMKIRPVIPFKFGTIFKSVENLQKFVLEYSDSLSENLLTIKDKEEWSVKIFCDRRRLNQQIAEISEDITSLISEIAVSTPGKAFILKRKLEALIEQKVDNSFRIYGQICYDELAILCDQTLIKSCQHKDVTGKNDEMILNATCFIYKSKISHFMQAVATLQEKYRPFGFSVDIAGPWPPFSFISIIEK